MPVSLHRLPLTGSAPRATAGWLLAHRPGPAPEDLASMLVLLPSSRACAQLGHALLEAAGTAAIILPRILTPARLADHLADMLGLDRAGLPDPALRPLILAPRLARLDWLADRPEAAPGLAAELVALFDELRLARRDGWILGGGDDEALRRAAGPGVAEVVDDDLARIRQAWSLYREAIPRDEVDRRVEALTAAAAQWPTALPSLLVAAHFARLDAAVVAMLRGLAAQSLPVHWLTLDADDARSRLLLATYHDPSAPSHPLAGARLLAEKVADAVPEAPRFAGGDLAGRLDELGAAREALGENGPLRLVPCHDPEHESRVVAAAVCEALAAGEPAPEILVATPDRNLAARIAAQLRDAGVDVDDSRGRPLLGLPAGRLLRDVLRVIVQGWPFATLLEVLTHPYVRLVEPGGRPGHAVRAQVLEAAIRRSRGARRGAEALRAIAEADDAAVAERRRDWSLAALVDRVGEVLAPLDALRGGSVSWPDAVAALRAVWTGLAPDRPLAGEADPARDHDDVGAVAELLGALEQASAHLERAPLAAIAAGIDTLLGDPDLEVRPHRQRHLPVRLVGLVEARLEEVDHLFLAGLAQDVFPGRLARPLLLPDPLRRRLDLAHWRARAGRDAELFLRLLHGAPRLTVTWPAERDGQPSLASPLVQRLLMVAAAEPATAAEPPLYRRAAPAVAAVASRERAFRDEAEPVPAPAVPPAPRLSHSSLQRFRDCPYRFLLADALGLRRPEPVEAAFTAADHGNLVHAILQAWLRPGGPGTAALAAGDPEAAFEALEEAAASADVSDGSRRPARGPRDDPPGGAVARRSLLALAPALVARELERHRRWRPAVLEAEFAVTLGEVAAWLAARGEKPPSLPEAWAAVPVTGRVDRVDLDRGDPGVGAVIDYKTGPAPGRKRVTELRELQVHLYGLALATGTVRGLEGPVTLDHGGYYRVHRDGVGLPATPQLVGEEELATGARAILDTAISALDPAVPFALVPDWQEAGTSGPLPCQYCEFRGVCRLEERDATPALAARLSAFLTRMRGGLA